MLNLFSSNVALRDHLLFISMFVREKRDARSLWTSPCLASTNKDKL